MKKQSIHINVKSLALAILLFFAFGTKEMHYFFEHAHEEVKVCDAQKGERHIHDQEYIHDECPLCDFTFSLFELQLPTTCIANTEFGSFAERNFNLLTLNLFFTHFYTSLRGPPSIAWA